MLSWLQAYSSWPARPLGNVSRATWRSHPQLKHRAIVFRIGTCPSGLQPQVTTTADMFFLSGRPGESGSLLLADGFG